ncbi:MlaA family lipoprotein [Rhodovulum bhavnagarense]|uniref:MlaA family lipoprotein n=1 Tax=Rhodovulum bhavnagarense TaxID=992286 RepID=UPI001FB5F7A0|nr:VacJ family lipoprotein [Rhodovulum bhavnagarense]
MRHSRYSILAVAGMVALAACTPHDGTNEFNDPYEARNRAVHDFNKDVDRGIVRPLASGYGRAVPGPLREGIGNFAGNLSLPGKMANSLLQLRPGDAVENGVRFLVNTTIGIGGLFDPATRMGAPEVETDFGETLHVWGFPEGAYVELPFLGPSTERDTVGLIVDMALDPLGSALGPDERWIGRGTSVGAGLNKRFTYSGTIDEVLYDSADSYAQLRIGYLQKRRHELGRDAMPDYFDPYDDPYATPYADAYATPLEATDAQ